MVAMAEIFTYCSQVGEAPKSKKFQKTHDMCEGLSASIMMMLAEVTIGHSDDEPKNEKLGDE